MTLIRSHLASTHYTIGKVYSKLNRSTEAMSSMEQATALMKALVEVEPNRSDFEAVLASCQAGLGGLQMGNGRESEAVTNLRKALRLRGRQPSQTAESYFQSACHHSLLVALASNRASGLSAAEGQAEGSRALDALREAVHAGFRDLERLRSEPDLEAIRSYPDFRILQMRVMDLIFPADPFVR